MSSGFVISEIDIDRCMNDRHRYNSDSWADVPDVIKVILNGENRMKDYQIWPKKVNPYPFVPSDKNNRKNRCMEILSLQAKGLEQRLISTGIKMLFLEYPAVWTAHLHFWYAVMHLKHLAFRREISMVLQCQDLELHLLQRQLLTGLWKNLE